MSGRHTLSFSRVEGVRRGQDWTQSNRTGAGRLQADCCDNVRARLQKKPKEEKPPTLLSLAPMWRNSEIYRTGREAGIAMKGTSLQQNRTFLGYNP